MESVDRTFVPTMIILGVVFVFFYVVLFEFTPLHYLLGFVWNLMVYIGRTSWYIFVVIGVVIIVYVFGRHMTTEEYEEHRASEEVYQAFSRKKD